MDTKPSAVALTVLMLLGILPFPTRRAVLAALTDGGSTVEFHDASDLSQYTWQVESMRHEHLA
jgi:hypothetical protein